MLLSGCAADGTTGSLGGDGRGPGAFFRPDFSARTSTASQRGRSSSQTASAYQTGSVIFGPNGAQLDEMTTGQTPAAGDGVQLNFQNADLLEFIDTVMGQALQLNYTVDPDISGDVTLSTARPLDRQGLFDVLETVLRLNGAQFVRRGEVYEVQESTDATSGRVDFASAGPGYGLSIIPLRYVSPQTLTQLVNGFGARPGALRVETTRNLMIVMGGTVERQSAIDTAVAFDVDWMEEQSVGILALQNARPETVIPELERIFATDVGGSGANVIQFMPMPRLKAVLAVSQNRNLIERAQTWVERLDAENDALEDSVQTYRVKYREAAVLAELLNRLFSGETATGVAEREQSPESEPGIGTEDAPVVDASFDMGRFGETFAPLDPGGLSGASGAVSSAPSIQADESNNSLIIFGDLDQRQKVLAALAHIDVPQLQVAINITMAEVRLTDQLQYGIQYFVKSNSVGLGDDDGSIGLFRTLANNISRELPGFNFVLGSEASPDIIINALDEITDVEVLSSPSLVVMENEEARFQVGDQVPIVTRTVTSIDDANPPVSNQVEYRDTGIIMRVRPRISEDGIVTMRIDQEISAVASNAGTLTPVISNRSISSSIAVVDGQTVLLGGLIRGQSQSSEDGIPGLRRMKGIGAIFGSTSRSNERTELLILIKPSIIRDGKDAQTVAEELQARMWELGPRSLK